MTFRRKKLKTQKFIRILQSAKLTIAHRLGSACRLPFSKGSEQINAILYEINAPLIDSGERLLYDLISGNLSMLAILEAIFCFIQQTLDKPNDKEGFYWKT